MQVQKGDILIALKAINLSPDIGNCDKAVAAALLDHFNRRTGQCDPSIKRLARLLGFSERTIFRSLKRIEADRLFKRIRHGGHLSRNSYEPNWQRFREIESRWSARMKPAASGPTKLSPTPSQGCQLEPDNPVTQTFRKNLSKETCQSGHPIRARSSSGHVGARPFAHTSSDEASLNAAGRLAAARKLGLAEVPVICLHGLNEIQRRQLVLADNRIALNAGWDIEMLQLELRDLSALGANLPLLGFTEHELSKLLQGSSTGLTDENEIPKMGEVAVTGAADIWCLGRHRIACGDATDAGTVSALLGSDIPMLMITDPPYGVNYDPAWRHRIGVNQSKRVGKVRNDERADWADAWKLFPGSIAYVWHGALHAATVADSLERQGFSIRAQIIWAKERLVIGRGDYHWQHEPCWYAVRTKGRWTGDRKQTTLWTIPSGGQDAETAHGTQKPVECMRRPILNNSKAEDVVYDPFLGSGTTLIAAEATGRACHAVELDPLYVDVAVRRWQDFTGEKATLQADGRSFDEIACARAPQVRQAKPRTALAKAAKRSSKRGT
jgi:DNA modification methylase